MADKRMPIGKFVAELKAALKRKDGYIMGSKGQNPKNWAKDSWWFTQYSGEQKEKALYWREHAARVWDCNGMAEGIYEDYTGVNINTKARYNYANWCGTKGSGTIPAQYRVPGAAVFIRSAKAGYITHVGYLVEPVNGSKPTGDWWVIEARGVMYGVVKTKLSARGWNRWGLMTKYFDYDHAATERDPQLGDRILKNGSEGADVKALQSALIRLGYNCGRCGADGDFGDATEMAVTAFQQDHGCTADGDFGPVTYTALTKALAALDDNSAVTSPRTVRIVGGNCWVRSEPNTSGSKLGVVADGDTFAYGGQTASNGWHKIKLNDGRLGWVSGKYSRLEG